MSNFYHQNGFNQPYFTGNYMQQPNYMQSQMVIPQMTQQPQMYNQQQVQQPQAQQQPMQPMEMPFNYFGYGNYKEVESHILFPNQKALFIDRANNMFYEKICNNDGISVINQYKRVQDKAENQAVEPQKTMPTIDLSNYATKDDLGAFASQKQYNELLMKFEQLQKQVMGVKNNVGIKG